MYFLSIYICIYMYIIILLVWNKDFIHSFIHSGCWWWRVSWRVLTHLTCVDNEPWSKWLLVSLHVRAPQDDPFHLAAKSTTKTTSVHQPTLSSSWRLNRQLGPHLKSIYRTWCSFIYVVAIWLDVRNTQNPSILWATLCQNVNCCTLVKSSNHNCVLHYSASVHTEQNMHTNN